MITKEQNKKDIAEIFAIEKTIKEMPDDWSNMDFMALKRDCGIFSQTAIFSTPEKTAQILKNLKTAYNDIVKK